jgi:CzcA family heavy metal efflux pump
MIEALVDRSIRHRVLVVALALLLLAGGTLVVARMPVDVFPDLTAPTVTVLTEAHGMATEEVETLVTFPVESALNGAPGVRRVRSSSAVGLSVVWVDFDWDTDIHMARQVVAEKLGLARAQLPPEVPASVLAPISSVMGEVMFVALAGEASPMELRDAADWVLRRRLLAIQGVSQVVAIGGDVKQFQVLASPARLATFRVTMVELERALRQANRNASGGVFTMYGQEHLIRGVGRFAGTADIENATVAIRGGQPVRVRQLARVVEGAALKRGTGSIDGEPAVVLAIQKQPTANTLELTRRIDRALDDIAAGLPRGVRLHRELFRQADFIRVAVQNVRAALRDGSLMVVIVLVAFLLNLRTTFITLTAVPLSLVVAALVLRALDLSINTMTLGGMAIAIGELVDDAIVDVENVFRRLRENARRPTGDRIPPLRVVLDASLEIRSSIVYATCIIVLVFLPLFFLSGVEGRLLAPLGISYVTSILASLVVALTVTPALCALLLTRASFLARQSEGPFVRALKRLYGAALSVVLARPAAVMLAAGALTAGSLAALPHLGRTFLPEFNEGSLTLSVVTLPGTSLAESDTLGRAVERTLLELPEVVGTCRRTGRAELDEHAQGVNASEIDVRLRAGVERRRADVMARVRGAVSQVPGVVVNIGQPISHRIDHILSGTRSAIAIKVFGPELAVLRSLAQRVRDAVAGVPGVVDLAVDQQQEIPQLRVVPDREQVARFGLTPGDLAEAVEVAVAGHRVTQVLEEGRARDLVLRYEDEHRTDPERIAGTLVDAPVGGRAPLSVLARLVRTTGPNTVERENVQRRVVVSCNVSGRDLHGVVQDIQGRVGRDVRMPEGYYVTYGGQFESEQASRRTILALSAISIAGIFLLLLTAFGNGRLALLVMVNLPLALIGGVAALTFGSHTLSVASLVGFVTLFGIASRNGIMMVSHFQDLIEAGRPPAEAVWEGSLGRLSPILMTALTAGLALVPLVAHADAPGNEIQAPMALVIMGGLLSSTALNLLLVPPLFLRFGIAPEEEEEEEEAAGDGD